jgi:hypothetical protein
MKFKINLVKLFTPFFFVFATLGCSEDTTSEQEKTIFEIQGENGFVGTIEGTDAFIALLVTNKEALVYVCNGDEGIYEWFRGNITNPENFNLKNGYGSQVIGKFDGSIFSGSVILSDATTHLYTATPNAGSESGIFQIYGDLAAQEGVVAGWILNSKSEERGSFRLNTVFQVTPVKPKTSTISFKSNSFTIQRYYSYHPDSISVVR